MAEGDAVLSETDGAGAGDAGIVLSRFLAVSDPSAPGRAFVELGGGREVRVVPKEAADLAVAACDLVLVLVGLTTPPRLELGFLSVVLELPIVERRSADCVGLGPADLLDAVGARDTRLAVPDTIGLLFSTPGLMEAFFVSSIELVDGLAT